MTQYTRPPQGRASDMFWDSLTGGGSSWVTCDCGTEWNVPSELEDGDERGYDWFRYVELDNRTFVEDCSECCAKLGKYEQWIWNNRNDIREYLRIRVDQQLKWAEQEKLLNTIAGIDRRV